jgi:hypothetical protein
MGLVLRKEGRKGNKDMEKKSRRYGIRDFFWKI